VLEPVVNGLADGVGTLLHTGLEISLQFLKAVLDNILRLAGDPLALPGAAGLVAERDLAHPKRVAPVRSFGSFRGQRSFQGLWWFATTGEHVGFESWAEREAVMLLDFDPDVVAVSSQPFCLMWDQPRVRRHVPDFFARLADGSALVIDVRPDELIELGCSRQGDSRPRRAACIAQTRLATR
jgi:hypothetical protein